ncbi:hypothetical protein Hanom_Chr05g00451501 [Helianthus anomalus]
MYQSVSGFGCFCVTQFILWFCTHLYLYSVFDPIFVLYLLLNLSLFRVDSLDWFNKFRKD